MFAHVVIMLPAVTWQTFYKYTGKIQTSVFGEKTKEDLIQSEILYLCFESHTVAQTCWCLV